MDGDSEHPHYRYGGMWKNKHEAVSAKKPKGVGKKSKVSARAENATEDNNDQTSPVMATLDAAEAEHDNWPVRLRSLREML